MKFSNLPLWIQRVWFLAILGFFCPDLINSEAFLILSVSIIDKIKFMELYMPFQYLESQTLESFSGYRFLMTIINLSSLIFYFTQKLSTGPPGPARVFLIWFANWLFLWLTKLSILYFVFIKKLFRVKYSNLLLTTVFYWLSPVFGSQPSRHFFYYNSKFNTLHKTSALSFSM